MNKLLLSSVAAVAAVAALPQIASASIVYDDQIFLSAQGFGNAPRILTIQGSGTESGCISVGAGGTLGTTCISDGQVLPSGNGTTNASGDLVSPLSDNQKFGIPTLAELGWTSGSDIVLLFNATEPAGNSITIQDITLKFYNATTGDLVAAIDNTNPITFDPSVTGNGSAGFALVVDSEQQTLLNNTVFNQANAGQFRIALESTLTGAAGGAESFAAVNRNMPAIPEPATWGMMLLGFGAIGAAMRRRRGATAMVRVRYA